MGKTGGNLGKAMGQVVNGGSSKGTCTYFLGKRYDMEGSSFLCVFFVMPCFLWHLDMFHDMFTCFLFPRYDVCGKQPVSIISMFISSKKVSHFYPSNMTQGDAPHGAGGV